MVYTIALGLILFNTILIWRILNVRQVLKKQIEECQSEKKGYIETIENLKREFEKALEEIQPLQDKQQNCKRGEWCKSCNFNKECYISAYPHTLNYDIPYSYHYCTKGICQEFIERK